MQIIRCAIGVAAIEAIPVLCVADTLFARWRGWQFVSRFDKLTLLSAAAAGLLSLLVLLDGRGRRFFRERWAHLLLFFGAVSCSVLAAELAVRFMRPDPSQAPFHGHLANLHRVFRPQQAIVPGVGPVAHFTTNSLGIRGPEMPDDPSVSKILCLGGSTTECIYLDDSKVWSRQLMLMLTQLAPAQRIWVGDMGYAGYSSTMHLEFVKRSDLMRKIDCLVILVGFNDLTKALTGNPTQHELLANDAKAPAWCRSRLLGLTSLRPHAELWRVVTSNQDSGGTYMANMRRQRTTGPFRDHSPDLTADLEAYKARLRSIVTGCRARGVRPVLLTQPVLWNHHMSERAISLLWHGWTREGGFLTVARLLEAIERFNSALVKVCQDMRTDCIDVRSMSGKEEFFYDDCHFTEAGAHELARQISASLKLERPGS